MVWEFLNTWGWDGSAVLLLLYVESCHSQAKISCDSGTNGIQKKASLKSNIEKHVLVDGRMTSRV